MSFGGISQGEIDSLLKILAAPDEYAKRLNRYIEMEKSIAADMARLEQRKAALDAREAKINAFMAEVTT